MVLRGIRTKGIKGEKNVIKRVTKGIYVNYSSRQIYFPGFYIIIIIIVITIIIIIIIISANNFSERGNAV